jgi:hypothetical protein
MLRRAIILRIVGGTAGTGTHGTGAAPSTPSPDPAGKAVGEELQPNPKSESGQSTPAKTDASQTEGEVAAGVEVMRWVQKPRDDRIVDENGEFIVSKTQWYTGELAYKTPPPPSHLEPRFGYQIVSVKKPITWWQHYRKNPQWSFTHVHIHIIFIVGITYLCVYMIDEVRRLETQMRTPHGMVGDQLGRGDPQARNQKIGFSVQETDEMVQKAQDAFMSGKELHYAGSKDYVMKKIPRPKEFSLEDSLSAYGVQQPKFTASAKLVPRQAPTA